MTSIETTRKQYTISFQHQTIDGATNSVSVVFLNATRWRDQ